MTEKKNDKPAAEETEDPYVYVDGQKEMKDGSGMVKESGIPDGAELEKADS